MVIHNPLSFSLLTMVTGRIIQLVPCLSKKWQSMC